MLTVGEVVKLDRGFPLVCLDDGRLLRAEQATALVKSKTKRAVIGDQVKVNVPDGHDKAIIEEILPRRCEFVRKDPTERALPQVLAANFDAVLIAQPLAQLNLRRLERELVLAHSTGQRVLVALTKADEAADEQEIQEAKATVKDLAGEDVEVCVLSIDNPASIAAVEELLGEGTTTILLGRSGVGKSTLVNAILGSEQQSTGSVRSTDGKGRHTTVSREIVDLPGGARVVDMPGVRGLGLWDSEEGIDQAFPDISGRAASCRFRDCQHINEPGCAVQEALSSGTLPLARFESYQRLRDEMRSLNQRKEEARWMKGDKKRRK